MEEYTLFNTEIDGKYRKIQIYPNTHQVNEYLIHWDGFEVGKIKKMDDLWYTNCVDLMPVANEIGKFIDSNGGIFELKFYP